MMLKILQKYLNYNNNISQYSIFTVFLIK